MNKQKNNNRKCYYTCTCTCKPISWCSYTYMYMYMYKYNAECKTQVYNIQAQCTYVYEYVKWNEPSSLMFELSHWIVNTLLPCSDIILLSCTRLRQLIPREEYIHVCVHVNVHVHDILHVCMYYLSPNYFVMHCTCTGKYCTSMHV